MERPTTAALLLLALALRAQDPPPPPPPMPVPDAGAGPRADPGAALAPGALPAGATATAREAWQRLVAASLGADGERKPLEAFDLVLDVVFKRDQRGTNDVPRMRYRFAKPGWVRITTRNERELVRGPDGDWLIDARRNEKTKLDLGRANAEDRRQLDEMQRIGRNFLALGDPASLRIASLREIAAPELALPAGVRPADDLAWLELSTPDFRASAGDTDAAAPPARVRLGIDRATSHVLLALLDEPGRPTPTTLIALEKHERIDGLLVPRHLRVFEPQPAPGPLAFQREPTSDVWLIEKETKLRAQLSADDFR